MKISMMHIPWKGWSADNYTKGLLDVTIPDPITRLRERYEDLKDLITDLRVDIAYLTEQCNRYEDLLKEHHLL